MKSENVPQGSLVKELLKELMPQAKVGQTILKPTIGSLPLEPSELLQDAGSGYNADFVDPQQ